MDKNELIHLRAMFEQAPGFMAITKGPNHVYELVNCAFHKLVGHKILIGQPCREALPEIAEQGYEELSDLVYQSGRPFVGHQMLVKVQQAPDKPLIDRYIDFVFQPLFDTDSKVCGVFIQGNDVTEEKLAQDALKASNERWKFAIEGARDGIWDWDVQTDNVVISNRSNEILGYPEEGVLRSVEQWKEKIHPADRYSVVKALNDTIQNGSSFNVEYRLQCADGTYKWVLSRGLIVARDKNGRPARLTGTLTDISEKKQAEEIIWHDASFDYLTGLPNRRLFRDRLEQEVRKAHRERDEVALLFIDLDRFKEINDLLGHDVGDKLLYQVSRRLASCVRESDTVARLGGDEFTVILTNLHGHPPVEQVAQKIVTHLAKPFQLGKDSAHISASVGITLYPADANEPEELIRNADQSMYAAKHAGRNRFCFFTKSMQDEAQRRILLTQDLRNALAAHQLEVYYQPVIDLVSHRIVKAEALLRWDHPIHGFVNPAQFIPLAEESGLIHEIGDWVFTEAATCSHRWRCNFGAQFQISVNRSPVQFMMRASVDWTRILRNKGLAPHSLAVEITESLLLNASPNVAEVLYRYRDAGIQVALDDFGTGYSSLAYLKQFDIDYIKIDQSFVRDIEKNEDSRAIAESTIAMAHKLGLKVIAEGIEKPEQETILYAAGCDYGQGFLFSKAIPPRAFEQLLVQQNNRH